MCERTYPKMYHYTKFELEFHFHFTSILFKSLLRFLRRLPFFNSSPQSTTPVLYLIYFHFCNFLWILHILSKYGVPVSDLFSRLVKFLKSPLTNKLKPLLPHTPYTPHTLPPTGTVFCPSDPDERTTDRTVKMKRY